MYLRVGCIFERYASYSSITLMRLIITANNDSVCRKISQRNNKTWMYSGIQTHSTFLLRCNVLALPGISFQ